MSDLDKLFENAPEGAAEIVTGRMRQEIRWAKKDRVWSWELGEWRSRHVDWQTIATRPQPEPRKTVEDAVEYYNGVWPAPAAEFVRYNYRDDWFLFTDKGDSDAVWASSYLVCTREQFEVFVAAEAAKSEPEWTHMDGISRCKIIATNCELSWVAYETGENYVVRNDCLKTIKPPITKSDCELLVKFKNHIRDSDKNKLDDMLDDFIDEHTITD